MSPTHSPGPAQSGEGGEAKFMTAVFKCDLRKLDGNPHHVETPFGKPVATGVGNAFLERDEFEELLTEALEFLASYEDVVDGDYGEPAPNKAMSLATRIREAL